MRSASAAWMAIAWIASALLSQPALSQEAKAGRGVDYEIDTSASSSTIKVGDRGKLVLAIVPTEGRKVHKQAPLSVVLRAPAGIVLDKAKLGRGDVTRDDEKRMEIAVEFAGKSGGEQSIECNATFFICTDKWCQRMTERVVVTVNVK